LLADYVPMVVVRDYDREGRQGSFGSAGHVEVARRLLRVVRLFSGSPDIGPTPSAD
jgi:hypothetical protein